MPEDKFKPDKTSQSLIFGYNVDDFLPGDHLARLVDAIVEELDTERIEDKYSRMGQKSYQPKSLIKIIFYGYAIGVFSSRKIRNACYQDLAFMYLVRMYKPDHRTISDFRKNNIEEIERYFVDILKYCNELGMLKAGNISIDGSKFRANASSKRNLNYEQYKKWEKRLREEIRELNEKAEKIDEEENNRFKDRDEGSRIPKEIKKREELLKKIALAKKEIKEIEEEYKKTKKSVRVNITDKDATYQKERHGVIRANYNAQISVSEDQLITGAEVSKEAGDRNQLIPMMKETEENTKQKINELKADSGYSSYSNYEELAKRNIDGYIPDQEYRRIKKLKEEGKLRKYEKDNFRYKKKEDTYYCPLGKKLNYFKSRNDKYRQGLIIYKCRDCPSCKSHAECTSAKFRTITRHRSEHLQEQMRKKLATAEGKSKYYERMNRVESIYGHFKKNLGFKQFLLRGLDKVRGEFRLLCIGYNLRKIYKTQFAI